MLGKVEIAGVNTSKLKVLKNEEAMELLRRTECTVTDAALALGFGSVRNFSRAFQKETGMTPAKWRKKP
jgi:RNA polymerase sporulation-specific sigma factor